MIRILSIWGLVVFSTTILNAQLSREQLEKDRLELIQKIENSQNDLDAAKNNKSSLFSDINALERQIDATEQLIVNLQQESEIVDNEISTESETKSKIDTLANQTLQDYYELLRVQYRNKLLQQNKASIWNSKKILEALTKYRIFKSYERIILAKGSLVNQLDNESINLEESLSDNFKTKSELLQKEQENLSRLKTKKAELETKAKSLSAKEKRIQQELSRKRREREQFNQAIENKIRGSNSFFSSPVTTPSNSSDNSISSKSLEAKRGFITWPLTEATVIKRYGPQPHPSIEGITITNNGIDLSSPSAEVTNIFAGKVLSIATVDGKGPTVIVAHSDNYYTVYSNLSSVSVTKNQDLQLNQLIGIAQTGNKGMAELHFEIWNGQKTLNPKHWLKNN